MKGGFEQLPNYIKGIGEPCCTPDQVLQGPCLDCVSTDVRRQNGSAGTSENRGKNRLIGREFDGDI
jgi:hypothetical protein